MGNNVNVVIWIDINRLKHPFLFQMATAGHLCPAAAISHEELLLISLSQDLVGS